MSFNFESLSSSSSDDDENTIIINNIRQRQTVICRIVANNNSMIQHLHNQQSNHGRHGGSVPGHIFINRDREAANLRLYNDYFADNPLYNESMFRRRYRMSRSLFLRIVDAVKDHDHYFKQRVDSIGRLGLSPLQKITAVFRILAYGVAADATDEYVKIGMLGSLDCMHWKWKNCPTAWAAQYAGRSGNPTIVLEAVADYDLLIWHAYFGLPGTNNDINVLESSHLFSNLIQGISPPAHYVIQEKEYTMGYYLADSIYPKWSTIVQTIHDPRTPKKKYFATKQEACQKDVERAFGALQSRFAIVAGPVRYWKKEVLHDIMTTCIILHNMIVEDERDLSAPIEVAIETPPPEVEMVYDENTKFQEYISRYREIRDKNAHVELRNALIEHMWEEYTNSET